MISVAMEIMELEVETELSKRPALEPNDSTALTKEQQDKLNQHKVRESVKHSLHCLAGLYGAMSMGEHLAFILKVATRYYTD